VKKLSIKEEVAKNLHYYRKKSGLTQKALGKFLDVGDNTVSSWENGNNMMDIDTLFKICRVLKVSVNDMYGVYANACVSEYTKTEKLIIDNYRTLNDEGQSKLYDYADDLVMSGKYKKAVQHSEVKKMA
jgi:transcriptional regulator with XRE-family HTH domain